MASREQILVESLAIAVASHYSGRADDDDRMFADIRELVGPLLEENERVGDLFLESQIELGRLHSDNAALRQRVAELTSAGMAVVHDHRRFGKSHERSCSHNVAIDALDAALKETSRDA